MYMLVECDGGDRGDRYGGDEEEWCRIRVCLHEDDCSTYVHIKE